jgi:hypothetical protein
VDPDRGASRQKIVKFGPKKFLVACPILFVSWLGFQSRFKDDSYNVPCGTPVEDSQVLAYAPYVREVRLTLELNRLSADRRKVLSLARSWDREFTKGRLLPLRQVSFEDAPTEGVRGEITRSRAELVSYLLEDADRLAAKKNYCDATNEVLLAMRLSESLKYSDFPSVNIANVEEKRELEFLTSNNAALCEKSRGQIATQLEAITRSHYYLLSATSVAKANLSEYEQRMGVSLSPAELQQTAMLSSRIQSDGSHDRILEMVRKHYLDADDDAGIEYLADLRLAWRSETETQSRVYSTIKLVAPQGRVPSAQEIPYQVAASGRFDQSLKLASDWSK